jgi:hypothetical protein
MAFGSRRAGAGGGWLLDGFNAAFNSDDPLDLNEPEPAQIPERFGARPNVPHQALAEQAKRSGASRLHAVVSRRST